MKNPKALAIGGAGLVGLVLVARSGASGGDAAEAAAPAPMDPYAGIGPGMVASGGYDFTTNPIPTVDTVAEENLNRRFTDLETNIGTGLVTLDGAIATGLGTLEQSVGGLSQIIADLQSARVDQTAPAPANPTPATPTPPPTTPTRTQATATPRWTPPAGIKIGAATDINGATFAGRAQLSNGQFAPIVKYGNGNSQIHPEWQRWMSANKVTRK
jgi:hypothetical protein